jgi:hypothetical protein
MFLRKRTLPFHAELVAEPALERFGVVTASGVSMPMIDQVPEDSQRLPLPFIGMPATAEAVSWQAVATTGMPDLPMTAATASRTGPSTVPGCDDFAENLARQAEGVDHLPRPIAGARVEQLRGGGDGALDRHPAGEPVGEQIRHEQQPFRLKQRRVFLRASASKCSELL